MATLEIIGGKKNGLDGQDSRFLHRTCGEIASLLSVTPLLRGERPCRCLTSKAARRGDALRGKAGRYVCPECGRAWSMGERGDYELAAAGTARRP